MQTMDTVTPNTATPSTKEPTIAVPRVGFAGRLARIVSWSAVVIGVAVGVAAWKGIGLPNSAAASAVDGGASGKGRGADVSVELVSGRTDVMRLPAEAFSSGRYKTEAVSAAPAADSIRLVGSVFPDMNQMARIHTLFSGQIVEVGVKMEKRKGADGKDEFVKTDETLRFGDRVFEKQLLAVIWSRDVGEKKSALISALASLDFDQLQLDRLLLVKEIIAGKDLTTAQQTVAQDKIQIATVQRTLRSWDIPEEEIKTAEEEAKVLAASMRTTNAKAPPSDPAKERQWAKTAVLAPYTGYLVEKNVNRGDVIDNTTDLFKVANLKRVQLLANAYEEELSVLQGMPQDRREWTVTFNASGDSVTRTGKFELPGRIIDPTQHSGFVSGWVDNADDRIYVGQFFSASIDLIADPLLVGVPGSALIESGDSTSVFVETDAERHEYALRQVAVIRRGREIVAIRAEPNSSERLRGAKPLRRGEKVLTTSVLELASEIADLKNAGAR